MASGGGSNLQSIIDSVEAGQIPDSEVVLVASDKRDAFALERAKKHGIKSLFVDPKEYGSRDEYDKELASRLKQAKVDLVLLAGYMRIVSAGFVKAFPNRIMNIHPALLPSFPGIDAQQQAFDYGVKVSGCTVHFVDEEVDHGPIIIQSAVEITEDDSRDTLAKRILDEEHRIYPLAVKWYAEGRLKVTGRRVKVR